MPQSAPQEPYRRLEIPLATIVDGRIIDDVGSTVRIPYAMIRHNPHNPRKLFDKNKLIEVANSYAMTGDVEQAIHIVLKDDGAWVMINDGERRWRAAGIAQLSHLSCFILPDMTDGQMLLSSFKANLHRESMTPIEEALGYRDLMQQFAWNQSELARQIGKEPVEISQALKYLNLTNELQDHLLHGRIEKGIALQLASYDKKKQVIMLDELKKVVKERGGRSLHPNDAARHMRGIAERKKIPVRPTSRGRTHTSHAQMVASHIMKKLETAREALAELGNIPSKELEALRQPHYLDLDKELERMADSIRRARKKFESFV